MSLVKRVVLITSYSSHITEKMTELVNPTEWRRVGRGNGFEFGLDPRLLALILRSRLPDKYSPYLLLMSVMERNGQSRSKEIYEQISFDDLPHFASVGFWQYFLGSASISGDIMGWLQQHPNASATGALSVSGLVNLQIVHPKLGSSAGIVSRIENLLGEQRTHAEYLRVFRALKRQTMKQG
jgi:hypothetical protein